MKQGSTQYAEVQRFYCKVLMQTGEHMRPDREDGDPVHAWKDNLKKKKCRSVQLPDVLKKTKSVTG
jgi:hypothetical protein